MDQSRITGNSMLKPREPSASRTFAPNSRAETGQTTGRNLTRPVPDSTPATLDDDSAVTILGHLEEERGKMFTEAEYRALRQSVLHELAHGARLRPFTIFTFGVVGLSLFALFIVGLITATGTSARDLALAIASGASIILAGYFFWSCCQGIKLDALRSLESRLAEVKQLLELRLISSDEYELIESHILIARQQSRRI